jgi:hypothetical protein
VFSSICQNFALRNFPSLALRASARLSCCVSRYYYIISSANNCCTLEPRLSIEIQAAAHTKTTKGGFKSEDTGEFFHCQHKYSKSLSWAESLNFPPKTVNNLFKFSAQDIDLEYLCWQWKNSPVSSDLKPPLVVGFLKSFLKTVGIPWTGPWTCKKHCS